MDIMVFDEQFTLVDIVDDYTSFIWTERYYECGDFEISLYATADIIETFQTGYFIKVKDRSGIMIIEALDYKNSSEDGNTVIVSGRSAECLLDYRDVYGYNVKENIKNDALKTFNDLFSDDNSYGTVSESIEYGLDKFTFIDADFQTTVEMILNETVLNPEDDKRKIHNLKYKKSSDPRFVNLKVSYDTNSDDKTLLDLLRGLHSAVGASFRVTWEGDIDSSNYDYYIFESYMGVDRSFSGENFDQSLIVFSSGFDNLISGEYIIDRTKEYNTVIVMSKFFSQARMFDIGYSYQPINDEDSIEIKNAKRLANVSNNRDYKCVIYLYRAYSIGEFHSDFDRKETFLDLSNIYPSTDNGPYVIDYGDSFLPNELPSDEIDQTPIGIWNLELENSVFDFLDQHRPDKSFSSELDPNIQWKFGEDYNIGDFVQIIDDYLFSKQYQVVEMIISDDSSGYTMYPTFEISDYEDDSFDIIKSSSQIVYGYIKSVPREDSYIKETDDNGTIVSESIDITVEAAPRSVVADYAKQFGYGYVYNNVLYG